MMKSMDILLMICMFISAVVGLYFLTQYLDGNRVRDYFRSRGEELLNLDSALFGPGFVGEQDSRLYQVAYRDKAGRIHHAYLKTSMLSGVYLTEDKVVGGDVDLPAIREKLRGSWLKRGKLK